MYAFNKPSTKTPLSKSKPSIHLKKDKHTNLSTTSLNIDPKKPIHHKKSTSFLTKPKPSNIDLDISRLHTEPFVNINMNIHPNPSNKPKHTITPNTSLTNSQKKMKILATSIKNNNIINKVTHFKKPKIHNTPFHKKSDSHSIVSLSNLSFNSNTCTHNASIVKDTKQKVDKSIKHNMIYNIKDKHKEHTKLVIKDLRKYNNTSSQYSQFKQKALHKIENIKLSISPKKKYNIIKSITNDFLKFYTQEHLDILIPLFLSYHSVFYAFCEENKKLQEQLSAQNAILLNNATQLHFYINELNGKEAEIEKLKKIINNSHSNSVKSTDDMSKRSNSFVINEHTGCNKEKESRKKLVQIFNQQNYKDLDALYFVDKVEMDSKSTVCHGNKSMIPSLQIESGNEESEEEQQIEDGYDECEDGYMEDEYYCGSNGNEDGNGKGYHSDGECNYGKKYNNNST